VIAIFGAGSIGCWVGGRLAAGGAAVTLIGRARLMAELGPGVTVTDLDGFTVTAPVTATTDIAAARDAAVVLVTVKSAATADAGRALAAVTGDGTIVVSLQNGVRNAEVLRAALPGRTVLAGMVPFNVIRRGPGAYHRASEGTIFVERGAGPFVEACATAGLPVVERDDMAAVQWAKLVLNLNNAINALSGLPLAAELAQRDYRRCLAAAQREALAVLDRANQPLARLTKLPARWIPRLLPAPDPVFRALARRIVAIDPHARSSMWDDLEAGRPTEIDYIQGEVVALAERVGADAPVNRALIRLIRSAEAGGRRDYTGPELRAELRT
jgi:2-dehydropantoate 2-reductase